MPLHFPRPDRFASMYHMQRDLQVYLRANHPEWQEAHWEDRLFRTAHALIDEVCELTNLTSWKKWKNPLDTDANKEERLKETIDIFFFAFQLAEIQGFTPEQLHGAFTDKLAENYERQKSHPNYRKKEGANE